MKQFQSLPACLDVRRHSCFVPAYVAWLGSALLFSCSSAATTLVGIWTPDLIVIAADSKQTYRKNGIIVGSRTECKIYPIESQQGIVVAFSGLAESDQISVIETVRKTSVPINEAKYQDTPIMIAAQSALEQILAQRLIAKVDELTVGLIIAIRGDRERFLRSMRTTLWAGPGVRGKMPFATGIIEYPEMLETFTGDGRGVVILGQRGTINAKRTDPRFELPSDPIAKAKALIQIEIDATPEFVGGPISVLAIDKDGARWVNKGACQWEPKH